MIACVVPASRVARIDAIEALRRHVAEFVEVGSGARLAEVPLG